MLRTFTHRPIFVLQTLLSGSVQSELVEHSEHWKLVVLQIVSPDEKYAGLSSQSWLSTHCKKEYILSQIESWLKSNRISEDEFSLTGTHSF